MAVTGSILPTRMLTRVLPAAALAAALAACQPPAPPAQEPAPDDATAGTTPAPAEGLAPGERINFQCNEVAVGATYDEGGETVRLSYSGQRLELPIAISASGARYADDAGNEFWSRGMDEATFTLAGEETRQCTRSDRTSPWDTAAEGGIAFRAIGQEPGWLAELEEGDAGEGDSLTAHLDYGQRLLEATGLEREGDSWSGQATDGTAIVLTVEERECADIMSGERFRAAATLAVDGNEYQGCGAWLTVD